ncbi:MAG: trypsin-like peptidase domain-containing protein [Chloroflexi bacterium]|nr:trypsin-like peptidase domain-containing protein [Chloroflexota bacterium]
MRKYLLGLTLLLLMASLAACSLQGKSDSENGSGATRINPNTQGDDVLTNNRQNNPVIIMPQLAATPTLVPVDVLEEARADDLVFINIYQRVNPAVVNIEVSGPFSSDGSLDASGSGFVIDLDGHVVTNAHVVEDANEILVTFSDGYVTTAELVGIDNYSDIAVIQVDVDATRLFPVEFGDSNELLVGERVVAIGNPFGLESSMTVGIISALGRALPSERLITGNNTNGGVYNNPSIIQVDATVNPGNSGGPILDMEGRVIGVATAIRTDTGVFQGVAFAVPVNTVNRVVPQLIENGSVAYPWLGVRTEPDFTVGQLAEPLNLPVQSGILVRDTLPDSPAEKAGLRGGTEDVTYRGVNVRVGGDIIVAINGVFVNDLDELLAYLVENTKPGDEITLTVVRGGQTIEIPVTLGTRDGND